MGRHAFITGVTGQDGSYLAELLIQKGYDVHGLCRSNGNSKTQRIKHLVSSKESKLYLHYGDLSDGHRIMQLFDDIQPTEVYNLAAQSHVWKSFSQSLHTTDNTAIGATCLLEAIRHSQHKTGHQIRFFQASSSEIFGKAAESPQNEMTPFLPSSPYGIAKAYSHWMTNFYRNHHGLHASCGILFNHESPRRDEDFVTRKITKAAARIKLGLQNKLYLGNLDAQRDWGFAGDYVEAMWLMLQQEQPDDYVIATNKIYSVREFCDKTFSQLGLAYQDFVEVDPRYYRPTDDKPLLGDSRKARTKLQWEPRVNFDQMINMMVKHDLEFTQKESLLLTKNTPQAEQQNTQRVTSSRKELCSERVMNKEMYQRIEKCRICGGQEFDEILNLGQQALTGVFPSKDDPEVSQGPLELVRCKESQNGCGLVQLRHSYNPTDMYGETYGYRSGLNNSMVQHLHHRVAEVRRKVNLSHGDLILDIGSNDATTLKAYGNKGYRLIGIDPSASKFQRFYPTWIDHIDDFFSADLILDHAGKQRAKIITSIAMFYDLENPTEFMQQVHEILADDGIWVFEQSYLPLMIERTAYDTICHEHISYYALKQIYWMADLAGLKILDVEMNNINGGSFCVTASRKESVHQPNQWLIDALLAHEEQLGYSGQAVYENFRDKVHEHRESLINLVRTINSDNQQVFGYGASTKGNVLLQFCGFNSTDIPMIAEVNPDKFGCVTPGTNIPIVSEAEVHRMNPDYMLMLPWHFRDHIIEREKAYLSKGGRFLLPLPRAETLTGYPVIRHAA